MEFTHYGTFEFETKAGKDTKIPSDCFLNSLTAAGRVQTRSVSQPVQSITQEKRRVCSDSMEIIQCPISCWTVDRGEAVGDGGKWARKNYYLSTLAWIKGGALQAM